VEALPVKAVLAVKVELVAGVEAGVCVDQAQIQKAVQAAMAQSLSGVGKEKTWEYKHSQKQVTLLHW
jgi:hypothetical protein